MDMKPLIGSLFLIFLNASVIRAQDTISSIGISWYPQLMFISGMRIDLDVHLGKSKSWLVFSPQVFLNERLTNNSNDAAGDESVFDKYNKLTGYGMNISHRFYIQYNTKPVGLYLGYGGFYNHYTLTYEIEGWGYIDRFGLQAITYGLFDHETIIDKIGTDFFIGYQTEIAQRLFVDIFCGGGIRYAFIKTDDLNPRYFSHSPFEFGYTGSVPLAGFRFGVFF